MTRCLSALGRGFVDVIRSPGLVAIAFVITFAAAVPFAVIVGSQIQDALANQPPIALGSGEIDADWWSEFRIHARGLAATFTPTVIGFAAPLDNLSSLLDGTRRPVVLVLPILAAMVAWAWFWGVVLTSFHGNDRSLRAALTSGFSHMPRFLVISGVAVAVQLVLYLTAHPLLFKVIYGSVVGDGMPERTAFAIRVILYLVFGALIASVSLVADYSRIIQVVHRPATVGQLLLTGLTFVRRHYARVLMLFALTGLLFVVLLAGYGMIDTFGGTRVGGWRGIALAQAYIAGRLIVRLTFAASELRLFSTIRA